MARGSIVCVVIAWVTALGVGLAIAGWHETATGPRGTTPARWPSASQITPASGHPTIVMFAHPQCPCTRASLGELARIMTDDRNDAMAVVAIVRNDTEQVTDLWRSAGELPHTRRYVDVGGREAARFGAKTSGHVVVYDASGALVFSGGITGSRGHAGDNLGARTVLAHATHRAASLDTHDVFGCVIGGSDGE